ncbi:hypothetical protein Tco_0833614 [Tanacetum coccineum]
MDATTHEYSENGYEKIMKEMSSYLKVRYNAGKITFRLLDSMSLIVTKDLLSLKPLTRLMNSRGGCVSDVGGLWWWLWLANGGGGGAGGGSDLLKNHVGKEDDLLVT